MIKQIRKGNPRWVREMYGKFRWEYQKDGKYYAEGYYKTAKEADEACLKHQELMDMGRNLEKVWVDSTDKYIKTKIMGLYED